MQYRLKKPIKNQVINHLNTLVLTGLVAASIGSFAVYAQQQTQSTPELVDKDSQGVATQETSAQQTPVQKTSTQKTQGTPKAAGTAVPDNKQANSENTPPSSSSNKTSTAVPEPDSEFIPSEEISEDLSVSFPIDI